MSKTDFWMPLYIADYLGDTMHLNTTQHGAYLLLLMHHWRNGPLPIDDAQLASIARTDLATWKKSIASVVMRFFNKSDEGWSQKRLMSEREFASDLTDKRSVAGRAGAAKRWGSNSNGGGGPGGKRNANANGKPMANAMANALPNGIASSSQIDGHTHSHIPSKNPPTPFPDVDCVTPCPETGKPLVNGYYLDRAAEMAIEAARINQSTWRGDYRPLIRWLVDDIQPVTIAAAIRRVASNPNYKPPFSLQYFDKAVREQPSEVAA